jgi:hypothetical protein
MKKQHTAWEILLIEGSFFYFICIFILAVVAAAFQVMAGLTPRQIVPIILTNAFSGVLGVFIYLRLKSGKSATALQWITECTL